MLASGSKLVLPDSERQVVQRQPGYRSSPLPGTSRGVTPRGGAEVKWGGVQGMPGRHPALEMQSILYLQELNSPGDGFHQSYFSPSRLIFFFPLFLRKL